jgi:hypothetical protein
VSRTFGPDNARLTVCTQRTGAAAKAGHDLLIEVTSWSATLDLGADPALTLSADPRSLRVLTGSGGMQALGDDDKASIAQTIDEDVLEGRPIEFHSTRIEPGPDGAPERVEGELELAGERRPLAFELAAGADGALSGRVVITQSNWGMKPYSALFGTLKVVDDVEVVVEAGPHGA